MAKNRQRSAAAPPESPPTESSASAESHAPPIWSRRMWTANGTIEVAIFSREVATDQGSFPAYNVTAKRTYKKNNAYRTAVGFRSDDVPTLIQLLSQAYGYIAHLQNSAEAK